MQTYLYNIAFILYFASAIPRAVSWHDYVALGFLFLTLILVQCKSVSKNVSPTPIQIKLSRPCTMGSLTLIIGPMFAEKTSSLLRYAKREKIANRQTLIIAYGKDNRYTSDSVLITHDGERMDAQFKTDNLDDIPLMDILNADSIFVDEGQFFQSIVEHCKKWKTMGKHVYICGLNGTASQEPWPIISALISIAERVEHLSAICKICGNEAHFSAFHDQGDDAHKILIAGQDKYRASCFQCLHIYDKYQAQFDSKTQQSDIKYQAADI